MCLIVVLTRVIIYSSEFKLDFWTIFFFFPMKSKVNLEIDLRNSKFKEYLNNNTMRKLLRKRDRKR